MQFRFRVFCCCSVLKWSRSHIYSPANKALHTIWLRLLRGAALCCFRFIILFAPRMIWHAGIIIYFHFQSECACFIGTAHHTHAGLSSSGLLRNNKWRRRSEKSEGGAEQRSQVAHLEINWARWPTNHQNFSDLHHTRCIGRVCHPLLTKTNTSNKNHRMAQPTVSKVDDSAQFA